MVAQERDGGCGFGDALPNDRAAQAFRNGQQAQPASAPAPVAAAPAPAPVAAGGAQTAGAKFVSLSFFKHGKANF